MTLLRTTETERMTAEDRELALSHPALFINRYGKVTDPTDPSKGILDFKLWPWQWQVLRHFTEHKRVVILKARQLGVSWLLAGYALWVFLSQPGAVILLISKREEEAKGLLAKAVFMYNQLPPELRFPSHKKDIDSGARFASAALGSVMVALPATPDAGRSETTTLVIPDEWAFQEHAAAMFGSYDATVGLTGQIIGASTAQGAGGFFYDVYQAAKRGENGFLPLFLPWYLRPGRTPEWREEKRRQYIANGTPELLGQEYPEDELDAFSSSVNLFFPMDVVRLFLGGIQQPAETRWDGAWRIWKKPAFGRRYAIGADVAEGVVGGDYSTAGVVDAATGEKVAAVRLRIAPDLWAARLKEVGEFYAGPDGPALIAPERNNHGILTINTLVNVLRYPNVYRHPNPRSTAAGDYGWPTNQKTKPEMLFTFRQACADGSFISYDEWLATEMQYFQQVGAPPAQVKYQATVGHTDDTIIADSIAWKVRPVSIGQRGVRHTRPLFRRRAAGVA